MGVALVREGVVTVGGKAIDDSPAGCWLFSPFKSNDTQWEKIHMGNSMPAMINPAVFATERHLVVLGGYKREVFEEIREDNRENEQLLE